MPTPKFFKTEFDMLAINDALGHPNGELAYAYLRVSSSGQAEEGRSGLPRQIQHIHEAALDHRLKIPWECVFADDDSGFEFVERPELSRLRKEYRLEKRKAHAVVIEHLDRLSRNADWHQGYLLDEMTQFGLQTVFWKQFSSRIERVVMGAVAQDGMEQAKQRMAQGSILKAKSGRVTAKTPAYGYKFVDSFGNEGPTAKKDTHYGIREDEAEVIRYIYQKVLEGLPLRRIAIMLEGKYQPPKRFTHWEPKMVELIVKRSLYKGEFIAHRSIEVKISATSNPRSLTESTGKTVTRKIQRPPEEWIIVPVPAIVDPEDWERANEIVAKNLGRREPKTPFLLTYLFSNYRCAGRKGRVPVVIEEIGCNQKQISTRKLDQAVWSVIYEVLLYPDIMIEALEKEFASEQNEQTRNQIEYLESQIRELKLEDEQLYKAYLADAFDENEYAEHRSLITSQLQKLQTEIDQLAEGLMTVDQFEERKQEILVLCQNAARSGLVFDAPFDVRQRIIHTIVEKITLNANEGWFEIEGVIKGQYLFDNSENNLQPVLGDQGTTNPEDGSIVYIPKGRDSSQPRVENSRRRSTNLWRG